MRSRKKKIFRSIAKVTALLLLPSAIAASASGISKLSYNPDNRLKAVKTPSPAVNASDEAYSRYSRSIEDILSGSAILSEGYGINEETEETSGVKLTSPLEMTAADPGDKPYPTHWTTGGNIIRNTYIPYSGTQFFSLEKGGQVNNKTSVPNETLISESRFLPNFTIASTSEPQVLIYHTHTTESFEPFVRENYDAEFNYRTTDETKNVIMVGDAIQAELEAQGIGVIHVRTIHDYPSYNGAYDRS